MRLVKTVLITASVILILISCTKEIEYSGIGVDNQYRLISGLYKEEDFINCKTYAEKFILSNPLYEYADSVQYMLAGSYYETDEYLMAAAEYIRLVTDFGNSRLIEDGYYGAAKSYYQLAPSYQKDSEYTNAAIENIDVYLYLYPNGKFAEELRDKKSELRGRLAHKDYKSGFIYVRLDRPKAALVYYNLVLEEYPEQTEWVLNSKLDMLEIYFKMRNDEEIQSRVKELNKKEKELKKYGIYDKYIDLLDEISEYLKEKNLTQK